MNLSIKTKTRLLHIDFLRILCIFLVMFTHTSTSGFSLYLNKINSNWFPLYIIIPFWIKTAVPIFFMISGALLLKKEEPLSVIFKKRIWRFAQVLIIFSFINYLYNYRNFNISLFSSLLYSQTLATAYYFLYIYMSFLLMLPMWRALVKNLTNKIFIYLISLNLFFCRIYSCFFIFNFQRNSWNKLVYKSFTRCKWTVFLFYYWILDWKCFAWSLADKKEFTLSFYRSSMRNNNICSDDILSWYCCKRINRSNFRTLLWFFSIFKHRIYILFF